jgi:tetratricopeptide (TPR) repeat protein
MCSSISWTGHWWWQKHKMLIHVIPQGDRFAITCWRPSVNMGARSCQRHLAYFVDLAERAEPNLRAFDMVMWLDRLEDELENIRLALDWALESDIETQLRLASAVLYFWQIRGHKNEGIAWWERGLSIEAAERGDEPLTPSRALIRGKALNAIGIEKILCADFDKAKTYLQESVALFEQLGPAGEQGRAYALTWLAGDDSHSKSIQEQNLTFFHEIGDKFGAGDCLMFLSQAARNNNEYERAQTVAEEHLALRREIGDQDGAATALFQLGHSAFLQQDYHRAVLLLEEGLSLFRAVGNKWALGVGLSNLGDIFLCQRKYEQASKMYEDALAFARDISDRFMIAFNSYNLGAIAWFQGDYARANHIIAESLAVFRDHDENWLTASCLHNLGEIDLAQGDDQRAMQWYEAELAFGEKKQLEISRIFARDGLGKVAWVQGNHEVAAKRFEEALRMSEKAGYKTAMLLALYGLGRVALSQNDYYSAGEFFTQASQIRLPETSEITLPATNELSSWISLKTYGVATAYPLEAFAVLAAAQDQMERAARLLGAVESLSVSIHFEMSAKERAEHDQAIVSARAALGEEAFAAAWAEGRVMTMEQAIAYALEDQTRS